MGENGIIGQGSRCFKQGWFDDGFMYYGKVLVGCWEIRRDGLGISCIEFEAMLRMVFGAGYRGSLVGKSLVRDDGIVRFTALVKLSYGGRYMESSLGWLRVLRFGGHSCEVGSCLCERRTVWIPLGGRGKSQHGWESSWIGKIRRGSGELYCSAGRRVEVDVECNEYLGVSEGGDVYVNGILLDGCK